MLNQYRPLETDEFEDFLAQPTSVHNCSMPDRVDISDGLGDLVAEIQDDVVGTAPQRPCQTLQIEDDAPDEDSSTFAMLEITEDLNRIRQFLKQVSR